MAQAVERIQSSQRAAPRVPPHNLQAEESLLGAMLLSRDAIVSAVEVQLGASDFYKPAHGHIFEAITSLYAHGEPADPVTVSEDLRRAGLLDAIGGASTLISLQAGTPAIGNASRYATIVEENSLLRRLIAVAGDIAELGYAMPDDVAAAVDEAEALVFDVAQRRVTDSLAPIRDLLNKHLDHIEALFERAHDITGVPTGYLDLDQQLAGLQPSNLVIVGGRPGTGKALALDTALPTPSGWTTMGAIRQGDEVLDDHGRPCRVTYATPVMLGHSCYEVVFDDGSMLVADSDHQWLAFNLPARESHRGAKRQKPRVVTTRQMIAEGLRTARNGAPNWYVPLAAPLELPERSLPLDPYLLGAWLGEGTESVSEVAAGSAHMAEAANVAVLERHVPPGAGVGEPSRAAAFTAPGVLRRKQIPGAYLRASRQQRLGLLRGLLDTAGTVVPGGCVELCLPDRELSVQARELVCSLGHRPGPIDERVVSLAGGPSTRASTFSWVPLDGVSRLPRRRARASDRHPPLVFDPATSRAITAIRPVPSVPVRCITVDSPDCLYLAGESLIPTHNTSFGLGMAAHAAVEAKKPVLVFSLEMSHLELTQRLLCSEARVDAVRMRNGRLLESDWPKISHAVERLAEAPLFIDDNPHLTVMEIRAKARRLKSREGLGLIVIDYLQLMTGRSNAENRQVEVSEISRGLKILARELDVPVVALSQLSRGLEARADKRPVLADLRESGCLPADTRVLRADTGAEVTMGELFASGQTSIPVWSLDSDSTMVPATMRRVFCTGVKPVYELRLASGRRVKATANHPFLTAGGWRSVDSLAVGERMAAPRFTPEPLEHQRIDDHEAVLLGHLLASGSMAAGQVVRYSTTSESNARAVEQAARRFGVYPSPARHGGRWRVSLGAPDQRSHGHYGAVGAWLGSMALHGRSQAELFVPEAVFRLPNAQVAHLLCSFWASCGGVRPGRRQARVYCTSPARRVLEGVQLLLSRFGITSRIHHVLNDDHPAGYRLYVEGAANQLSFLREVLGTGVSSGGAPAEAARRAAVSAGGGASSDARPAGAVAVQPGPKPPATGDVMWDTVVSVRYAGTEPVFDAQVDHTHNFVANNLISSNSLEQDADVVIFIYRDEIYNRDSPDRGTAEVIVAKHRNGPTGVTQLAFLDHYTRFANMAKGV